MAEEGTFTNRDEVLRKAGAHVSTTASAEAYTNQFIKEIEGWIMTAVRKDNLISEYDNLPTPVKELLRLITSNLSALSVIQYDMTGFDVRLDAENQIKLLWGVSMEAIKELQRILIKK